MDKLLVFVVMLFATNLAVAFPMKAKKISGQFGADFKVIDKYRPTRVDSIPGMCEETEICELVFGVLRICKKIEKCTQ